MEKRLIVAIALSMLVIALFQHMVARNTPPVSKIVPDAAPAIQEPFKTSSNPDSAISVPAGPAYDERTLDVETGKHILTFSNIGGSIKAIRLKDYKGHISDEPMELLALDNPKEYLFALNGFIDSTPSMPLQHYEIVNSGSNVSCHSRVNNVEIIKSYILQSNGYGITASISFKNVSFEEKNVYFDLVSCAGLAEQNNQDKRYLELSAKIDGITVNLKRQKNGRVVKPGLVGWLALKNKYFSLILKPLAATKGLFYYSVPGDTFVAGIDSPDLVLPPASFVEFKYDLYAGPTKASALKEAGHESGEIIRYGIFDWIAKALLAVTAFFYGLVHSWGLAIVLLSVFLNILLFPLSMKSFKSMKKMQELHPEMEKLKAQHKDNPQKLNKEMLELYKKYNINPFSGCLPLLLQMPVFIALYNALSRSIELKGASFLWIKDLSKPDAVSLPVTLPLIGNSINILPLLMVLAMVGQQRISSKSMGGAVTEEQKQQQKMMMVMMPVIFGFIFYNMPSGLVLYWLLSTTMTTIEQFFMLKES